MVHDEVAASGAATLVEQAYQQNHELAVVVQYKNAAREYGKLLINKWSQKIKLQNEGILKL